MPINKLILISVVMFSLIYLAPSVSSGANAPIQVKQGGIARIIVTPGHGVTSVSGRFKGKTIPAFKKEPGMYITLVGIDMDQEPGRVPFIARWKKDGKVIEERYEIKVEAAKFGLQRLTLPKKKVDLDPPTLTRVKGEKRLMKAAFESSVDEKLWNGTFIAPVKGKRQGTFGRRRLINGKPRRSHTGEDISAPTGTPILAPNNGRVVLVGHFFFNGRAIVIDHGLGLFSMYFHLSEIDVAEGEKVKTGKQIGRVGKSGRVTGPHLHWGMRLNSARIDPYALLDVQLD